MGNRLSGTAGVGLEVTTTEGCRIRDNSMRRLEAAPGPDLHLGAATSDCLAFVSADDLVVDDGTANQVIRE